jgi:hypothetical protein
MNEGQESGGITIFWSIWRKICFYQSERQVGKTGARPSTPVVVKTRRKPLKTERLQVFQFGVKLPSFR